MEVTPAAIKKIVQASEMLSKAAQKKLSNSKSCERPVGVVKATPRSTPTDNKRSTSNVIKADEVIYYMYKCVIFLYKSQKLGWFQAAKVLENLVF